MKDLKDENNPILRGIAPCPSGIYRIKYKSIGKSRYDCGVPAPMLPSPTAALGLFPSVALSPRVGSKIISLPYKISTGRLVQHDTSFQRFIQETAIRALQQSVPADIKWLR